MSDERSPRPAGKTALLSVSDKTGLVPFARKLVDLGFTLVSTGGTLAHLVADGLPVTAVDEVTGFPELLDGRVKTLHPHIHAGILARRSEPEHMDALAARHIDTIDLVCVNLYPFAETVAKDGVTADEALEQIDIGGPTLVRAAAKNYADVLVVVDPKHYDAVTDALAAGADVPDELRHRLAAAAFRHTATYDAAIADWFAGDVASDDVLQLPPRVHLRFEKLADLRYGENPHQRAALYAVPGEEPTIARAEQLGGKQLSFNNINDADAALRLVMEFGAPAAVAVKHTNPCGVGLGVDAATAFERAFRADEVSIFGGIVAFNRPVDVAAARLLNSIFLEVIIAPDFTPDALAILRDKAGLRLLRTGAWPGTESDDSSIAGTAGGSIACTNTPSPLQWDAKRVAGGMLIQTVDEHGLLGADWRTVGTTPVTDALRRQLELAWLVCKHVKSNAIVLAKGDMTVGIGAGQTNRIDAARHALAHAATIKSNAGGASGAVMASDAFFPFPDVVQAAGEAGIAAIVQPGGSIRDKASIEAANRYGMGFVFTGRRHFRH